MAQRPTYASREQVADRMGVAATAYVARRIDETLQTFSRMIEKRCQRPGGLYPSLRTLSLDWPTVGQPTSWRLWLAPDEAISLVSLSSGGTAITGAYLVAGDGSSSAYGPPYNQIQLDRAGAQFLGLGGASTPQRSVLAQLWLGFTDDQVPAGALAAAVASTSTTSVTVTNGALGVLGVGDLLTCGTERCVITDKAYVTSGATLSSTVAADRAVTTLPLSSGALVNAGEVVLVDSERMFVLDVVGNNATVRRQWDGTVLAAHTSGATVYAPRLLTVARGAVGSTAATHLIGAAVTRWEPPPEARALAIAETQNHLAQESAGWARVIVDGDGGSREVSARGLRDLRQQVYGTELRRKGRSWAV